MEYKTYNGMQLHIDHHRNASAPKHLLSAATSRTFPLMFFFSIYAARQFAAFHVLLERIAVVLRAWRP